MATALCTVLSLHNLFNIMKTTLLPTPHKALRFVTLLITCMCLSACQFFANSPSEYFDRAALNSNAISRFGGDYFNTYMKYIKGGNATSVYGTCEKYVKNYSIATAENSLKKVKELYPTKETKPMIDASIDLFTFVLQHYKDEHLKIARMIDQQQPNETISQAIIAFDDKYYNTFLTKYNKLWDLAKVYADNNGIKLTQSPF